MDKQVDKLRDALSRIPGDCDAKDDKEISKALDEIDLSLKTLSDHPKSDGIHKALTDVVAQINPDSESPNENTTTILESLNEDLKDYEDSHPGVTLLISRLANALAVYGL